MGGKSGKSEPVTIGYRYYWDIQAGLGRGAVNEIVSITADKKIVFAGREGELATSRQIYINKPNLFGGEDVGGEGGIQGSLDVMMGDANQVPAPSVYNLLKGIVPGFRGVVTTLYSGLISCFSSTPKPWAYRVRRTTKGWDNDSPWYPEKATILLRHENAKIEGADGESQDVLNNLRNIHAMNPAHILYEAATNCDWGRGLHKSEVDDSSFKAVADTLFDERFGLCFRYNRQESLDSFIQQILDHIGATQYAEPETGKLTLQLIRNDYQLESLPLFHYDNGIINVQDDDASAASAAVNEIVVSYRDPVTNTDGQVRVQNLGAIQSVGVMSEAVSYPACPTFELAARLGQRDLDVKSASLARFVIQFDRRAGMLRPAGLFRINLPDRGIENMVLRVGKIEEQSDSSFKITAIQDVFGLPQTVYNNQQQENSWTPPDFTAYPIFNFKLLELPYAILVAVLGQNEAEQILDTESYIGTLAEAPTSMSINYLLDYRAEGENFQRVTASFSTCGYLTQSLDTLSTELYCSALSLEQNTLLLIDDEFIKVNMNAGKLEIVRGCLDSLPSAHYEGSTVWLVSSLKPIEQRYLKNEIIDVRMLTQTTRNTLAEGDATVISQPLVARHSKPYLPGRIAVNGVFYPDVIDTALTFEITWAHRDRVLQADQIIDCMVGNIGTEGAVTYCIEILDETGMVVWSSSTTQNKMTLPYIADTELGKEHIVQLYSQSNKIRSLTTFIAQLPKGTL